MKALLHFSDEHTMNYVLNFRMSLGQQVASDYNKNKKDSGDDIRSILHHSGMLSARLDRFEEVSSRMRQLEWSLIKRAAANTEVSLPPAGIPAGD
jgi:hypothetical protein